MTIDDAASETKLTKSWLMKVIKKDPKAFGLTYKPGTVIIHTKVRQLGSRKIRVEPYPRQVMVAYVDGRKLRKWKEDRERRGVD